MSTTSVPHSPINPLPKLIGMKQRQRKRVQRRRLADCAKQDYYEHVKCVECGSGDKEEELLLCDKCDRGYHMVCVKPIVALVPTGNWYCPSCIDHPPKLKSLIPNKMLNEFFKLEKWSSTSSATISPLDSRKRKRRSTIFAHYKKNRRLLTYIPSKDDKQRRQQMRTLATALKSLNMEFSNDLTYLSGMAPESANKASLENGGMQVLSNGDIETYNICRAMAKRGEFPPLRIVYDQCQGYTVEADGPIKDMTLIAEYAGDVDYITNRTQDDSDGMMTLLLAVDPNKSLVTCADKRGNISRFFSGINNHIRESKKKRNVKCVRYNINGACRNLLVATRDIAIGEKLYFDYNGHEHAYPTQNFV